LRADAKSRAEYWTKLHAIGVVSADYIASKENLPKPPPKPKPMLPPANPQQNGGQTSGAAPTMMADELARANGN
jgi:hypothetical protein